MFTEDGLVLGKYITFATFTLFYALSSKAFLSVSSRPLLLSSIQSLLGSIASGTLVYKEQGILDKKWLNKHKKEIFVVVMTHCLGTILTDFATKFSSASFVNTLKAADPLYTVVLVRWFLKEKFTFLTHVALFVIVCGVFLTCITEFNFVLSGFIASIIANTCFPIRTTFAKRILNKTPNSDQLIFFSVSISTFVIGFVPSLIEGWYAEDSIWDVLNISSGKLLPLIQAMLSHCIYNMVSFSLLGQMTALTYSVGNSIKRLIIIYCSILYFGNPVTHLNMLGSLIAVLGVFIYSYERELNAKRKPKATIKVVHV